MRRPDLSADRQRQLVRLMQVVLAGLFLYAVVRRNVTLVVNTAVPLAITFLPGVLARDFSLPMNAGLALWITLAVFLHAVGAFGPYEHVPGYDYLTHALSASIVAGVGYTVTRALDEHSDAVVFPSEFLFVYVLIFVVAFGVFWEILEFALEGLADVVGGASVLAQRGLDDTVQDLLFDAVGALVVAIWGTDLLTRVSDGLARRLDA